MALRWRGGAWRRRYGIRPASCRAPRRARTSRAAGRHLTFRLRCPRHASCAVEGYARQLAGRKDSLMSSQRSLVLVARARSMRSAPTPSEQQLWAVLRTGAAGVCFKRQVVLGGRFIVDFFAPSVGLVVEVDGGAHDRRRSADARRDVKLRRLGYVVLRLEAEGVMRDIAREVALVVAIVEQLQRSSSGRARC